MKTLMLWEAVNNNISLVLIVDTPCWPERVSDNAIHIDRCSDLHPTIGHLTLIAYLSTAFASYGCKGKGVCVYKVN